MPVGTAHTGALRGARGCAWVCALLSSPPAPAGTLHGGKLLLGAFTLGFCQIPAGVSLGDAAKPPGRREAAWCRRSPYKPRHSANPSLPTTIPPPALFFRLSWLTMPRLCPISKEPCPGAADAADPPVRGRPRCSCSLMGSGLFGSVGSLGSAFVSPRGSPCASPLCSLVLSESPLSYETPPAELLCRKRGLGWGSQQILKALETRGTRSHCPAQRELFGKHRCGLGRKTPIYLLKRSAHFSSP